MESVAVPGSAKRIRMEAFKDCTGLKAVAIPDGVKEIGWAAFRGCTAPESPDIPGSVEAIRAGKPREGWRKPLPANARGRGIWRERKGRVVFMGGGVGGFG